MNLTTVKIDKPEDINFILGQSHFIKTVEDIHEAMVNTVPGREGIPRSDRWFRISPISSILSLA